MIVYRVFADQGREVWVDTLASSDPFGLAPADIVERVLALGCVPDVAVPRLTMWPMVGQVFEVRREEQDFLVAIVHRSMISEREPV